MNLDKIGKDVCEYYSITESELYGKTSNETITWAKRCFAFILFYHSDTDMDKICELIQRSKTSTYRYITWFEDVYIANREVRVFISSIIYYNS